MLTWPNCPEWICGWSTECGATRSAVQRVLRSQARDIATEAEITTIAKDTSLPPNGEAVGRLTVDDYLDALPHA